MANEAATTHQPREDRSAVGDGRLGLALDREVGFGGLCVHDEAAWLDSASTTHRTQAPMHLGNAPSQRA